MKKIRPSHRRREELAVNLTPLIDVVFLLLIFFMISTTFRKEVDLDVELPKVDQPPTTVDEQRFEVAIDVGGNVLVNQRTIARNDDAALSVALRAKRSRFPGQPLVISADENAPHGAVVWVMDTASRLGIERVSIAAIQGQRTP